MEALIKNVPHAQPFALSQQVDYQPGKVVSLTLAQQPGVGITLFAFDAGEAISTHAVEAITAFKMYLVVAKTPNI